MSSKLGTSLRAIKLLTHEIGETPHKPMWVLPDGLVAVKDGIELVMLGKEDFFSLLHHGGVSRIQLYTNSLAPDIDEDIGAMYSSWPPEPGVEKSLSWADLVEAAPSESSGKGDTPFPVETKKEEVLPTFEVSTPPTAVSPATERLVHDQISSRIIPIPIAIGKLEMDHPVFKIIKDTGGSLPYPILDGERGGYLDVPYKRVRQGKLSYRLLDSGQTVIEMDPNRVDISRGPGVSMRLHRTFSLFT